MLWVVSTAVSTVVRMGIVTAGKLVDSEAGEMVEMMGTQKGEILVEWMAALLECRQVEMSVLLQVAVMVAAWVVYLADGKVDETVEKLVVCLVARMVDGLEYWWAARRVAP